jgi:uncharacterized protein (DUF4415 family)
MRREGTIVRYTAEELDEMRRRGEDRTNIEKVLALTEEELEASIDYEEEGYPDWGTLSSELPGPMVSFAIHFDRDVLEWFQSQGPGYQTKINNILKSYIAEQAKKTA